jgi:uncharacterized iron-regulated membrane protein
MGALWPRVNRGLTWFHRWSGVVLCLLFIAWFASGAVLLYVPYPALAEHDRLARSEAIDVSRVTHSATEALAAAPEAKQLVLISVAGQPIYLAYGTDGIPVAISGDDVSATALFPAATAQIVAERFGNSTVVRVDGPVEYDQWIVHQRFDPFRPFYRVRLNDPDQTDLYVSARTGQVLQRTRGGERAWNWCGAVLHWLYFTPLRKSWSAWNQTVWWLSLVALLASVAGTWLGIHRFLKTRATGRSDWSPFRGWMRWHHVIGLFASVIVLFWMLSGWLSMDHGRLFSKGSVAPDVASRFQGMPLEAVVRAISPGLLPRIGAAAEIRFGAVAGRPFVAARGNPALAPRVLWLGAQHVSPISQIPSDVLISGLRQAWPGASVVPDTPHSASPDFYAIAESLGERALPFTVSESQRLRVYVDGVTGEMLVVMDASRRAYAWVYYALHTFNFPGLLEHPVTRVVLVLALLGIGLAFSATGVVLGIRRLRRSLAR